MHFNKFHLRNNRTLESFFKHRELINPQTITAKPSFLSSSPPNNHRKTKARITTEINPCESLNGSMDPFPKRNLLLESVVRMYTSIPDPVSGLFYPGSRGKKGIGSRIRISNTGLTKKIKNKGILLFLTQNSVPSSGKYQQGC